MKVSLTEKFVWQKKKALLLSAKRICRLYSYPPVYQKQLQTLRFAKDSGSTFNGVLVDVLRGPALQKLIKKIGEATTIKWRKLCW